MKTSKAIEVLQDGGYFHIYFGTNYHGKTDFMVDLRDCDRKKVKGFGRAAFRDCISIIDQPPKYKEDTGVYGYDCGIYRIKK